MMVRMQIVIVRHASHDGGQLTPRGRRQVERLARALEDRRVRPTVILSSERPHALNTAQILARQFGANGPVDVVSCGPLYPVAGNPGDFDDVVHAAQLKDIQLRNHRTVMLVGHEGRVSGLVVQLTGARDRPIPAAGAVGINGEQFEDLIKGRGTIDFRYPVVDHQEAALRPKVLSKMTVATFLAGFVSAALLAAVFADEFTRPMQFATVLLTLALALLVATVYIYDELGMPEGYWGRGSRSWLRERLDRWRERGQERRWKRHASGVTPKSQRLAETLRRRPTSRVAQHRQRLAQARWIKDDGEWRRAVADEHEAQAVQDGPLYTWMVATWRWVFTPALLLALAGFGILIFEVGTVATGVASAAAVIAALWWLAFRRAPLGTD